MVRFEDEPADAREAIVQAAYRALREDGCAGKFLLYPRYDGQDELLLAFRSLVLERFEATVPDREYAAARDHLEATFDHALPTDFDSERSVVRAAVMFSRIHGAMQEKATLDAERTTAVRAGLQTDIESGVLVPNAERRAIE